MLRKTFSLFCIFCLILSLCACGKGKAKFDNSYTDNTPSTTSEKSDVNTNNMDFTFTDKDTGKEIVSETITDIEENEDIIKITKAGAYNVTGNHSQIVVEAANSDKIQINLSNTKIHSSNGPAIYIKQADKVFISVKGENDLSDSENYDSSFDNADAVIFSKDDLTINGSGTLTVTSAYKSGIVSKDDLVISDTTITATSIGAAIEGKDCVKLNNPNINIESGGDGIKSENDEDANSGYIYVNGGAYNITAENDGFQSSSVINIENGTFNLKTGGGSAVSSSGTKNDWGMWGRGGFENNTPSDETTASAKGIKATSLIKIADGSFTIDSSDDSLHSNSDMEIINGTFNITSGDDGIHADDDLIINGGNIKITKSYEGIEATVINISGGNIDVTASDDGLNSAGGNDASGFNRPGANPFESDSESQIYINDGYLLVNASGDGLDSNGDLTINGGTVLVSGPENNGNGALDYGGNAVINGGTAVIVGSSGMSQSFGADSKQVSLMYNCSTVNSGTTVSLSDDNKVIASFIPAKQYSSIIISTPDMTVGESYTLSIGGTVTGADQNGFTKNGTLKNAETKYEIELTSISTSNGTSGGFGGGMGGRPGGGMGGKPDGGNRGGMMW